MADILKITTPLVNKSQMTEPRRNVELQTQFPLQDPTRVTKPSPQGELLGQNNGLKQEETSALLLNLLKDPSVTVNFLKNIFAMQAIIKLLPLNNSAFTQELEQMFNELIITPEQIAPEMMRQGDESTLFKGEVFDFLRSVIRENPEQKDLINASVNFLKAITLSLSRREALGAVGNSLRFLSQALATSNELSTRLARLADQFGWEDAPERFEALKQEAMGLFSDIEESILFSPKMAKVLSMTTYNLSRYNDNVGFLSDAVAQVLTQLRGDEARDGFLKLLGQFLHPERQPPEQAGQQAGYPRASTVMEVLTRILGSQTNSEEFMLANADKLERIIHSLLSSPCNFTPLLHFVVPVQYENIQSFAEMWVNPNGEEDDRKGRSSGGRSTHMLLVFDITGIGRFELELFVREREIDFSLFCPPAYATAYREMENDLRTCVRGTDYRFGEVKIDRLERARSLIEVFKSLPYKRTGVDVKI